MVQIYKLSIFVFHLHLIFVLCITNMLWQLTTEVVTTDLPPVLLVRRSVCWRPVLYCTVLFLQVMMNLSFQEAARGIDKKISVNITDTCDKCQGRKHEPGRKPIVCPACHGTGMVREIGHLTMVSCHCALGLYV